MKVQRSCILVLLALAGQCLSAAAEKKSLEANPRSWMAFYTGSSNYTGAGGDLDAVRYGVSLGSDFELGKTLLLGGSISLGNQHFTAPDVKGDSKDFFLGLYARKTFLT